MHTEGHDMGKDAARNIPPHNTHGHIDPEHPGYEVSDVNVRGVAVFLGGLAGSLLVFFVLCWAIGKGINTMYVKLDGPPTKWNASKLPTVGPRDLTSNAQLEQEQLQQMTSQFPQPRLETDDGEEAIANLHAREDLLLGHYSIVDGQPGTIRIPIERAMELIAQKGLPVENANLTPDNVAYASHAPVQAPLTTGFARTGYELTQIAAREQKLEEGKEEASK